MSLARTGIAILLLACPVLAQENGGHEQAKPDTELYDEVWRLFKDQFYDRGLHGVDWEAAGKRHRDRAEKARTPEELHDAINALIGELKASHAGIIEGDVYRDHVEAEARGQLVPEYGLKIVRLPMSDQLEGWFVADVSHGSAAMAAGVRRGDRLLMVDGTKVEDANLRPLPWDPGLGVPRTYRLPTPGKDQVAKLDLERSRESKKGMGLYTVPVQASDWNFVEATRASRTVVVRHGVKIGYIRLYHLLSDDVVELLADFLMKELREADAIVVDLRGMGGLPRAVDKIADMFDPNRPGGSVWGRTAVAVIDKGTRSAKEMVAWEWRNRRIGPLVGTTSAGAVIGASFMALADGSYLLFPSMDMRSGSGGALVEGKGVQPDFPVEDKLPWCGGKDPLIERALEVAWDQARAAKRRGKAHGWY